MGIGDSASMDMPDDRLWLVWQLADSAFPAGRLRALVRARSGLAARRSATAGGAARRSCATRSAQAGHGGAAVRLGGASTIRTRSRALDERCDAFLTQPRGQPREPRAGPRAGSATCERSFPTAGVRELCDASGSGGSRHFAPVFGAALATAGRRSRGRPPRLFLYRRRSRRAVGRRPPGHRRDRSRRSGCSRARRRDARSTHRRRCGDLALDDARADGAARSICGRRRTTGCTRDCFSRRADIARHCVVQAFRPASRPRITGHPHTHEHHDHPGLFHERDAPLARDYRAARVHRRHRRAGGQRQDRAAARALPRAARPHQPRRRDQRHLHARGRRVPRCATRRSPPSASAPSRPAAARTRRSARTSATTCVALEELMDDVHARAAVRRERRRQPRRAVQPRARRLHDLRDRRGGRRQDSAQGRPGHHAVRSARHQQDRSRAARRRGPRRDGARRAAHARRRPYVFAQVTNGVGVDEIVREVLGTWKRATETHVRAAEAQQVNQRVETPRIVFEQQNLCGSRLVFFL